MFVYFDRMSAKFRDGTELLLEKCMCVCVCDDSIPIYIWRRDAITAPGDW